MDDSGRRELSNTQHGTPWARCIKASLLESSQAKGLVDAKARDADRAGKQHDAPARARKQHQWRILMSNNMLRQRRPGSLLHKACNATARMRGDGGDVTVMEGHEGCAWGRRVGPGGVRFACFGLQFLNGESASLGVRALLLLRLLRR